MACLVFCWFLLYVIVDFSLIFVCNSFMRLHVWTNSYTFQSGFGLFSDVFTILENVVLSMDIGQDVKSHIKKNAFFLRNDHHTWAIESFADKRGIANSRFMHVLHQPDEFSYSPVIPQTTHNKQDILHPTKECLCTSFFSVSSIPILRMKSLLGIRPTAAFWLSSIFLHSMFVYCGLSLLFASFSTDGRGYSNAQFFYLLLHLKTSAQHFSIGEKARTIFFSIWNMCKVLRAPKLIAASAFHFCITHMFQWPNMMLIADASNNLE